MFRSRQKIIPIKDNTIESIKVLKEWILGRKYDEAIKIYSNLRVVKENDKDLIVTMEYAKDRCNIVMKNGIIVDIVGFY